MKRKLKYACFTWLLLLNVIACYAQDTQTILDTIFHTNSTPIWDYTFLRGTTKEFLENAKNLEKSLLQFEDRLKDDKQQELVLKQAIDLAKLNKNLANIGVNYADQSLSIAIKNADIASLRIIQKEDQINDGIASLEFMKKKNEEKRETGFFSGLLSGAIQHLGANVLSNLREGFSGAVTMQVSEAISFKDAFASKSIQADNDQITERQSEDQIRQMKREKEELKYLSDISIGQINLDKIAVEKAQGELIISNTGYSQAIESYNLYKDVKVIPQDILLSLIDSIENMLKKYIKYSIILAKLTEKAYEAEEVVKSSIIKNFDEYEGTNTANWFTADRILLDLNTIEFNRITQKKQKPNFTTYTLSLSNKDPFQMEQLRQTGRMNFDITQFELDLAFPGTYAQTIKNIDISVIALAEPGGIKGLLTKEGLSWKKVPEGIAGKYSIRDWFQYVRSGYKSMIFNDKDETLIFPKAQGINQTQGLLGIFEGKPLPGTYTLELPKYANNFDYNSLADVIITINFASYYDHMLKSLIEMEICEMADTKEFINGRELQLSMRLNQPDDWYEFRNPNERDSLYYKRRYIPIYVRKDFIPTNHLNPTLNSLAVGFLKESGYANIKPSITSMAMNPNIQLVDKNGLLNTTYLDSLKPDQWFHEFTPFVNNKPKDPLKNDTIFLYKADTAALLKRKPYMPDTLTSPFELWVIKIEADSNPSLCLKSKPNVFDEQKLEEIVDINFNIGYGYSSDFCRFAGRRYAWMKVDKDTTIRGIDAQQHKVPYLYVIKAGKIEKKVQDRLSWYDWNTNTTDSSFELKSFIHKDAYADLVPFYSFLGPKTPMEEVDVKFDLTGDRRDTTILYCEPSWIKIIAEKTSQNIKNLKFDIIPTFDKDLNPDGIKIKEPSRVYTFDKIPIELKFRYTIIPNNKGTAMVNIFIAQYDKSGKKSYARLLEKGATFTAWREGSQTQFALRIHREDYPKPNDLPNFILKDLVFRDLSRF